MNGEKQHTEGISVNENKFLKWFDNYWFHYKWPTIGIAFALIVVLICTLQMCTKEKEDITILYAGPFTPSNEQSVVINDIFNNTLPKDYDGDGVKNVVINRYQIYSEEQIKEIMSSVDEFGVRGFVDRSVNADQYQTYNTYLLTGESSVLLLDPWLFEHLVNNGNGVLMPLADVFDGVPENNLDGYGITLGETELYGEYAALRALPSDTVVCLMRPIIGGKSNKEKNYQIEKEMYAAITGVTVK